MPRSVAHMPDPEPPETDPERITALVQAGASGDARAQAQLFEQVYAHLHAIAQRQMAGEPEACTLQPTALVHEAWLRMLGASDRCSEDRAMFFATAARAMRQVLIDHARGRRRQKRGGGRQRLPASLIELATECGLDDVMAVDEALQGLAAHDARAARIVELRFFAGLPVKEVAVLFNTSERTIEREWAYARAWLFRFLGAE